MLLLRQKGFLLTAITGLLLLATAFATSFASASTTTHSTATALHTGGGHAAAGQAVKPFVVNPATMPKAPLKGVKQTSLPLMGTNVTANTQNSKNVPHGQNPQRSSPHQQKPTHNKSKSLKPRTPGSTGFQGIANDGPEPPDMALGASSQWVFQGVNNEFAVYDTSGNLQQGWPKTSQTFFNVPSPGQCVNNAAAFMSDPRAAYDSNDQHFWAVQLEIEGVAAKDPSCTETSLYWVAVSQTSDPNGLWNVYAFNMRVEPNTTNWADYVQFGFDQQAIYFSANMFSYQGAFQYSEFLSVKKADMEQGKSVGYYGYYALYAYRGDRKVFVDTPQPIEAETSTNDGPPAGLFIDSFNSRFGKGDTFGNDCNSSACHGVNVWALTNPGTPSATLSYAFVDTNTYIRPPDADQTSCDKCIDTLDTRISGTTPYRAGLISFGLVTAVQNSHQSVPGILWGQVSPQFKNDGTLAGASLYQQGLFYYDYSNNNQRYDAAAYYPSFMPDTNGDLFMVFNFSGSDTNPSVAYVARPANFSPGGFPDPGIFLQEGSAATVDDRWGDYSATSYNGSDSNLVWFAGEYAPSDGTWATAIGVSKF